MNYRVTYDVAAKSHCDKEAGTCRSPSEWKKILRIAGNPTIKLVRHLSKDYLLDAILFYKKIYIYFFCNIFFIEIKVFFNAGKLINHIANNNVCFLSIRTKCLDDLSMVARRANLNSLYIFNTSTKVNFHSPHFKVYKFNFH